MARRLLDVAQGHAGVQRCGDEGVAQGVGPDLLGDARSTSDAAHDPSGGVAIQALTGDAEEDRALDPLADRQVDGPGGSGRERNGCYFAALAPNGEDAVATFDAHVFDVGPEGLGDAQAVECQQRHQGVVSGRTQAGGHQKGPKLVAIEADGVGLEIDTGPANMGGRRVSMSPSSSA
jgi:hypothetical protein